MGKRISIQIGLLARQPGWQILLDQIGAPWSVVDLNSSELLPEYSLIIANKSLGSREQEILDHYVEQGGALLHTPSNRALMAAKAVSKKYITSLLPQSGQWYRYHSLLDLYHWCFFFAGNEFLTVEKKAKGLVSYLGFEVNSLFVNGSAKRKNFFAETPQLPNEIVAKVSKGAIRQLLTSHFEYLHRRRNIPFIHKWYYPNGEQSLFTFRVDSDKGNQEQIEELFQLSERYKVPTTWFLDIKSHETWLPYFKKFTSQEIGIHCYEHRVYNNTALNEENFLKAKIKLSSVVGHIGGIAAPTGAWNENLQSAFEHLNFDYSSEFGFDYDNLPSFPWAGGRFSPVLQIPIYPVCAGSMRRARMNSEDMVQFFRAHIDNKLATNEPICLYHHPTHGYNEVFENIFRYINEQQILKMSFSEYSRWWRYRLSVRQKIFFDGTTITVQSDNHDNSSLRIIDPSGNVCITKATSEITVTQLNFYERNFPKTEQQIIRTRQFDLRHVVQNFLDWWVRVTE